MKPAFLWLEHVMGFEATVGGGVPPPRRPFASKRSADGSGLRSTVMWDEAGIQVSTNEQYRPAFSSRQIKSLRKHRATGCQARRRRASRHFIGHEKETAAAWVGSSCRHNAYYEAEPARWGLSGIALEEDSARSKSSVSLGSTGSGPNAYL